MTSCRHISLTSRLVATTAMTGMLSLLAATASYGLPTGGQVTVGQATVSGDATTLTVTQSSNRAVLNWRSFDIAQGERVDFRQPSSSSIALNRVSGSQAPSQILGSLTANGTVVLVNPNGIVFGPSSQVNVGSLVATSSDMSDERFMADDYRFDIPGRPDAAIVNRGSISVADAGLAAFVAPNVVNDGLITAKLGKVQLASGDAFTLDLYGDGLVSLQAGPGVGRQLVSNSGLIAANGGKVLLTAAAAGQVVDSLINMDGIIQATSIGQRDGQIVIFAEGSNAVRGNDAVQKGQKQGSSNVLVSGILDASGRNPDEKGGKVTVTGDNVALLAGTFIDASGYEGKAGTTSSQVVSAYRDGAAGGDIRIGGDYLGQGDTPTAKNLYVDPQALILNDALHSGDAGRSIFWSDGTTQFYGNVYARALGGRPVDATTWHATAGGNVGDGGFVETSGHGHLDAGGYADLTARNGKRGTYFLDPTDITIYGNVDPAFQSTDGSINLASSLKLWLDASDTSKVTLTYNSLGTTATGTVGSNALTVSANTGLVTGARIRLGGAGSVTTADTLGGDTYTVQSISGTTVTLTTNLTTSYSGSAVYEGYVSQLTDKSGQGYNATQATPASMPLWVSNGQNGLGVASVGSTGNMLFGTTFTAPTQYTLLISTDMTGATLNGFLASSSASSSNTVAALLFYYSGWDGLSAYPSGFGSSQSASYTPSSPNIISVNVDSTNAFFYNAGSLLGSKAASPSVYTIGNLFTPQINIQPVKQQVGDIVLYNSALSTYSQAVVNQYQAAKWAIALTPPGTGATEAAKATASDGYSVFTTRYLERLSQSADISLQATNNITLDLKGDTLAPAAGRSLSLTAGNQITTASAGSITTNGGNIALTGTNGILLNHSLGLTTNGGNLTFSGPVTLGAAQTWNAGSGLTTAGRIDGAHNLTATAGSFSLASPLGQTTPLGAVSLTSGNAMTLPTIFAHSISATTTSGDLTGAGGLITDGGDITLTAANDLDLSAMGLVTNGGNATLSSGRDTYLNTWISTGTGDLTVNAMRDLFVTKNDLTTGLVGWYKLDEGNGTSALDSSGNGNTGALTNGPNWNTNDPYGLTGNNSLSFDGVNDYVDLGSAVGHFHLSDSFTVSAWVNPTLNATDHFILGNGWGVSAGYMIRVTSGNKARFILFNNSGTAFTGIDSDALISGWHLVTGIWNGVTPVVYIDGVLRSVTPVTAGTLASIDSAQNAQIGAAADPGNQHYFAGLIDDVRIYNTELSASDVQKLYAPQVSWGTGATSLTAGRNVSLDLKGDTLAPAAGRNLTITAANNLSAATAGTIVTSQNAGAGGNATLTATNGMLDSSNVTVNAGGAATLTSGGAMTLGNITAKTIAARSIGAANDLTIASGKTLTASGNNTAITLAAGRNLVNSAGSSALSAPSGRWLVYSSNPAADTLGGLASVFRRFSCTYGGSCPSFPNTGNGLLYSTTPTLTATAVGASLTYGDAAPNLSGYGYSLSGYLTAGDQAADSVGGSLNGSTPYSAGSSVGTYDLNYASGSLSSDLGYGFTYASNAGGITVGKKTLSVIADDKTKPFGEANPALTASYSGFAGGEALGTSGVTGSPLLSTVAIDNSPAGAYPIIAGLGTLAATNYSFSFTDGLLTVLPPAAVTIPDAASLPPAVSTFGTTAPRAFPGTQPATIDFAPSDELSRFDNPSDNGLMTYPWWVELMAPAAGTNDDENSDDESQRVMTGWAWWEWI